MVPFPTTIDNLSPRALIERYYWACRDYLVRLLRRWQVRNVEDVADAVLVNPLIEKGLQRLIAKWKERGGSGGEERGRFRYYLMHTLRNAAATHLRRPEGETSLADWDAVATEEETAAPNLVPSILTNALKELKVKQKARTGIALYPEVQALIDAYLRAAGEGADTDTMAELLGKLADELREDARPHSDVERVRASRARKELALCLAGAVAETLLAPTRERVLEELADLGLLGIVMPYLPSDWPTRGEAEEAK
jgi:hypothetical protein